LAGRAADPASRHPPLIATLIGIPANLGYLALALLVGLESSGLPLPGEPASEG